MVRQLVRQLVYSMFMNNNCASFYLWWKEILVKHQNASKYYENDYRSLNINSWFMFSSAIVFLQNNHIYIWCDRYQSLISIIKQGIFNISIDCSLNIFSPLLPQLIFSWNIWYFRVFKFSILSTFNAIDCFHCHRFRTYSWKKLLGLKYWKDFSIFH